MSDARVFYFFFLTLFSPLLFFFFFAGRKCFRERKQSKENRNDWLTGWLAGWLAVQLNKLSTTTVGRDAGMGDGGMMGNGGGTGHLTQVSGC